MMDVTFVLKIAGIGMLVSISYMVLNKSGRDEMALMVSLGGIVLVLLMILGQLSDVIDRVRVMFGI